MYIITLIISYHYQFISYQLQYNMYHTVPGYQYQHQFIGVVLFHV